MSDVKDEASGTGALSEEILGDARKRAERAVRNAEREAEGVLSEARKTAEAAAGEILEAARARGEKRARVMLASLAVEEKRLELAAKEEVIEAVLKSALEGAGEAEDRREVIGRLAVAAAGEMSGEKLVVRVGERDAGVLDEGFLSELGGRAKGGRRFTAGRPAGGASGGVMVETADGREVFDNTFEARVGRLREALRAELARRLWDAKDA